MGYLFRVETDLAHYRRRAAEEYLSYANAKDPAAREIHLKLAKRYEQLARSLVPEAENLAAESEDQIGLNAERTTIWL